MALTHLVITLLTVLAGNGSEGASDAAILQHAEAAFRDGCESREAPEKARQSFRTAAAHYETLRQRGARNAALERNLGNAHLLAGDLPNAILAYRRGLCLAPADRDLQGCLAHARAQVAYPGPGRFGRPLEETGLRWLYRVWPGERLVLAVVSYSLAWLALLRWLMNGCTWLLYGGSAALTAAALLAASLAIAEWEKRLEASQPLVVVAEDGVLLRKGNGLAYPPTYETPLNRGVEARLRFARGEWLQVELAGGELGWVPRRYVLLDD